MEKTFTNFEVLLHVHVKVFSVKYGCMVSFGGTIEQLLKFSPVKVFHYTVFPTQIIISLHYDPLYTTFCIHVFLPTVEAACLLVGQGVSPHTTHKQNIHTDIPGLQTGEYRN